MSRPYTVKANTGPDKSLRIALVGPLPPPSAGMANQTHQLAKLLRGEGIHVDVVQVNAPYNPSWLQHFRGLRALFRLRAYLVTLWRVVGRTRLVHVMANSGWSWHLFAAPAIWIGWLRRTPVVVNYRGGEAERFFSRSWFFVRPTLSRCRAVIVPSSFLRSVFGRRNVQVSIVPNIVDLAHFSPISRKEVVDYYQDGPHIIVTRNLEPIYDIGTALRAFAKIRKTYPRARLTIAGTGFERPALEALAQLLGLVSKTHFAGAIDNFEMPALYRGADLMLNSSLADNLPISILEALASGVPIVSSDVGGVPHLVQNYVTALLVPPNDPDQMADAALKILTDRELKNRLIQAGLSHVKQFAWEEVRKRLFEVYRETLGVPSDYSLVETSQ